MRALNPSRLVRGPDGDSARTGEFATPESLNAIAIPLAHVCGRIVPVYQLRPTDRPCDATEGSTVNGWTTPYLPTHGTWRVGAEDDVHGVVTRVLAPVRPQFSTAHAVNVTGVAQYASAEGARSSPIVGSVDTTWDDGSTTATSEDSFLASMDTYQGQWGPGSFLNPHIISAMYDDYGPYALTCRDLVDPALVYGRRGGTTSVVQTGEEGDESRDPAATMELDISIDQLGTETSSAWLYVGTSVVHGANSESAPTDSVESTGDTVIPDVCAITEAFGGPTPLVGQALTVPIRDVIHAERTAYGNRFACLLSHMRSDQETGPDRMYAAAPTVWTCAVRGAVFALHGEALPGSANHTTAGTGAVAATRGALRAIVRGKNFAVAIGVRTVTRGGGYGQTTTYGAWDWDSYADLSGSIVELGGERLLPTGIAPGEEYEIAIWWRAANVGLTGYLQGWMVEELPLTSVG